MQTLISLAICLFDQLKKLPSIFLVGYKEMKTILLLLIALEAVYCEQRPLSLPPLGGNQESAGETAYSVHQMEMYPPSMSLNNEQKGFKVI